MRRLDSDSPLAKAQRLASCSRIGKLYTTYRSLLPYRLLGNARRSRAALLGSERAPDGYVARGRDGDTASRESSPAGSVRVKILPKDPLVARRDGLWPVEVNLDCITPESGPSGPHAVVVDYNADLDTRFAPAVLQANRSFRGIARVSGERLLNDFNFHQVNMWSIVERTIAMIEDEYLMGRPVPWAFGSGRLILLPHAGYLENAFYDRGTGAFHFFYFQGSDGKPVYTCLSHDVVAHELGHAILDGLKPNYNEVSSPETAGFHEYFGDAVAMMASLSTRETALVVVRGGPDKLKPRNVVSAIASEFGAALRGIPDEDYLRGAWNNRKMERPSWHVRRARLVGDTDWRLLRPARVALSEVPRRGKGKGRRRIDAG